MSHWLKNPHLDLTTLRLETDRCIIVPFSSDGRVDIHELWEEFCKVNKDYAVGPIYPTYEQEIEFVAQMDVGIQNREYLECFILEKDTGRFIGCIGLNRPEEISMNFGLWLRESDQGLGYGTESYAAILSWARENVKYEYLTHSFYSNNEGSKKLALKFGGIPQEQTPGKEDISYHIPLGESSGK